MSGQCFCVSVTVNLYLDRGEMEVLGSDEGFGFVHPETVNPTFGVPKICRVGRKGPYQDSPGGTRVRGKVCGDYGPIVEGGTVHGTDVSMTTLAPRGS